MTKEVREKMYHKISELLNTLSKPESAITPLPEFHIDDSNNICVDCPGYCQFKDICDEVFKWGESADEGKEI